MGLWDKILRKKEFLETEEFEAQFGRFTDANKTPAQYEAWDNAVLHFEKRDYKEALEEFIKYIKNIQANNIIQLNDLKYQIFQGSKAIDLSIKQGQILAQCQVAKTDHLHIGIMRRLLDLNYELKYVRYGLADDNVITLLFETTLEDASPYKLYFALKELAIHADKQDDLLLHEFDFLFPIRSGKTVAASAQEQTHKLHFFKSCIVKSIALFENGRLKTEQYPTVGGYVLMGLLYKLDYLIRPEGKLMDRLEQMHKSYFSQTQHNILQRLKNVKQEFASISELPPHMITENLYQSTFTFGFTSPANIAAAFEVIDRELLNTQWYLDNQYDEYVIVIIEYAIGLSLFNFALPEVIKELFTLVYRVTEPDYFKSIRGFDDLTDAQGSPDRSLIRQELSRIEKQHKNDYEDLSFDFRLLKFGRLSIFTHSYLVMIRQTTFQKPK